MGTHKALLLPTKVPWLPRNGICAVVWSVSQTSWLFSWFTTYFTWKDNSQANYDYSDFVFGRHFLKNQWEWHDLVTSRIQLTIFAANDKIWAFQNKLEFWKICICDHDHFTIPKEFSEEFGSYISKFDYWTLENDMYQHLRSLHDFLNNLIDNQCIML